MLLEDLSCTGSTLELNWLRSLYHPNRSWTGVLICLFRFINWWMICQVDVCCVRLLMVVDRMTGMILPCQHTSVNVVH